MVVDEATKVDAAQKTVLTAGGNVFPYDKLSVSTGASSLIPPMEGRELSGLTRFAPWWIPAASMV